MFDDPHSSDDPRDRDDDSRDRDSSDPRDTFLNDLDLPRDIERELVRDRDRDVGLRGSEARTLATVGAFRVVSSRDLSDHDGRSLDPNRGDLRHLREEGLVRTVDVQGHRDVAVVLTDRGRDVLEAHRRVHSSRDARGRGGSRSEQQFYADLKKPRELEHDLQVYRAYLREAERLRERGARIERVVLDYELKRDYQRFLQERNRGRADSDGRPDRSKGEVRQWAHEHALKCDESHVRFPDARIEYVDQYERHHHLDIEVVTLHYRGAHGAAAEGSGASIFRGGSARTGGSPFDPDYASKVLR